MNIFRPIIGYIRLKLAIHKAEEAHARNGQRFYVIPAQNKKQLVITDRRNFRIMRMKKYFHRDMIMRDVDDACIYYTAHRNEESPMSRSERKRRALGFYRWLSED